MTISFTAQTNRPYVMVNYAKFLLTNGKIITVDRYETDYSIDDTTLSMDWCGCYIWDSENKTEIFPTEEEFEDMLHNAILINLELEDDYPMMDEDMGIETTEPYIVTKILWG